MPQSSTSSSMIKMFSMIRVPYGWSLQSSLDGGAAAARFNLLWATAIFDLGLIDKSLGRAEHAVKEERSDTRSGVAPSSVHPSSSALDDHDGVRSSPSSDACCATQ